MAARPPWKLGDRVKAKFAAHSGARCPGHYFPGTVSAVHHEVTYLGERKEMRWLSYDIDYDDNDHESRVAAKYVRPLTTDRHAVAAASAQPASEAMQDPKMKRKSSAIAGDSEEAVRTTTDAKKQRSCKTLRPCRTWLEFIEALESLVGSFSVVNACTETYAEKVRAAVLSELNDDEKAFAQASWAAGNSVTACGRKVGDRAVVRAACCAALSHRVTIEISSTAQAKLWAAFPGGPDELLAALGPDAEQPYPEGCAKMESAIRKCGMLYEPKVNVGRINLIHRILLVDQQHSMERLKEMDYDAADLILRNRPSKATGIKGLGPKLTACVLSFTCDHHVLAVDTNVMKAVEKLGWAKGTAEAIHDALNGKGGEGGLVPREIRSYAGNVRATLHGLLLNLGQIIDKEGGRGFVAAWRGVELVHDV